MRGGGVGRTATRTTRRTTPSATPSALRLGVAALLCLVAVVVAGASGPPTFSPDSPLDRFRLGERPGPDVDPADAVVIVPDRPPVPAREGIPVEVVISLAASVVLGALLARSLLRARPDEVVHDEGDDDADQDLRVDVTDDAGAGRAVAEAARRGLDRLDRLDMADLGQAGQAVLACWVELEAAGERVGRGRTSTDTATDFAARLAVAVPGLDPSQLADLRRTYSRVRFGRGAQSGPGTPVRPGTTAGPGTTVGPDEVRRAQASLEHLLAVLDPVEAGGVVDAGHRVDRVGR